LFRSTDAAAQHLIYISRSNRICGNCRNEICTNQGFKSIGVCASVSIDEIAKQEYILTSGRYVGIEEQEDDSEPFNEKNGAVDRRNLRAAETLTQIRERNTAEIGGDWF